MKRAILCVVSCLFMLTCIGDSPVELIVYGYRMGKKIGNVSTMKAGTKLFAVDTQISNNTSLSIPVTVAQFWIITDDGLSTLAAAQTALLDTGCPQDAMLEPGATVRCDVVFEIDLNKTPRKIRFVAPGGETAVDEVNVLPCSWCGNYCYDLETDPEHCGSCSNGLPESQNCVDGEPVCNDSTLAVCGDDCADLLTSSKHCGQCDQPTNSDQVCRDGERACTNGFKSLCGTECVDLRTDPENCGKCGTTVPTPMSCVSGKPG